MRVWHQVFIPPNVPSSTVSETQDFFPPRSITIQNKEHIYNFCNIVPLLIKLIKELEEKVIYVCFRQNEH